MFDWKHAIALHAMHGNRASSRGEGEVAFIKGRCHCEVTNEETRSGRSQTSGYDIDCLQTQMQLNTKLVFCIIMFSSNRKYNRPDYFILV